MNLSMQAVAAIQPYEMVDIPQVLKPLDILPFRDGIAGSSGPYTHTTVYGAHA